VEDQRLCQPFRPRRSGSASGGAGGLRRVAGGLRGAGRADQECFGSMIGSIGVWTTAAEDARGLWVKGRLAGQWDGDARLRL